MDYDKIIFEELNYNNLDLIRVWKNRNKQFFFNQLEIEVQDHLNWFEKFKKVNTNTMVLIKFDEKYIGCIGARIINSKWDIFNVMNINKDYAGKGIMSYSLFKLFQKLTLIRNIPITAKVLKTNKNINWYLKNNFEIINSENDYFSIKYKL